VGIICAAVPATAETEAFHASYTGQFTQAIGAGPGSTNVLEFSGAGTSTKLGNSTVKGRSLLQPVLTNPLCSTIVQDQVTLTA
jgi:hypothetical protein